mmetsp:Transcript_8164/g.17849  ORF Transcript_8164/g.17849 Transcript_8164/m.17849 type:complete len:86 (+) Transcript_8164:363-620(+)
MTGCAQELSNSGQTADRWRYTHYVLETAHSRPDSVDSQPCQQTLQADKVPGGRESRPASYCKQLREDARTCVLIDMLPDAAYSAN